MKLFEKKDSSIIIEEDDIQDAKLSSLDFVDTKTRKRAFLNVLGARLAMKMLFSQKIDATNLYSLYTIHNVVEELDIADIYFQGIKIDVRVVFNKEEIFIPKSHFELDLLPDLYLVLDLAEDFSGVEFLGFFEPKTLNTQNENKGFYFYEYDRLQDPKTLKMFLHDFEVIGGFKAPINLENAEALFVSLVDKEISKQDKENLFKCLAGDIALREKAVEFENFETLSKEVVKDGNLMQDSILDIVGAQQIYEDEELTQAEEKAEIIGEVLTDLLDGEEISVGTETKRELNQADLEELLSEVESEHKNSQNNNLGAFTAGAVVGGAVAGTAAAAAALGAAGSGVENNLLEILPDVDLDLDLNLGDSAHENYDLLDMKPIEDHEDDDLTLVIDETSEMLSGLEERNDYESKDNSEEFFDELSGLDNLPNLPEEEVVEDNSLIEAKFFGGLDETVNLNEEIEEANSKWQMVNGEEESETKANPSTLQPSNPLEEEIVSLDEIDIEGNEEETQISSERVFDGGDEDETLQRLRQMEEDEDSTKSDVSEDNQDEFISQVDDFLKDADFSGDSAELLEGAIDLDNFEDISLMDNPQVSEDIYSSEADIQNYEQEEDLEQNYKPEGSDEQIKLLFNDGKTEEIPDLGSETDSLATESTKKPSNMKDRKMVIAASVLGVVLISVLVSQSGMLDKSANTVPPTSAPIAAQGQAPDSLSQNNLDSAIGGNPSASDQPAADTGSDPLLQPAPDQGNPQANANRDMGKAVSDAFLSEPVSASISKVAWEVPEDLAYNDGFRKYLQMAGKNLKLNLQNNLLLATEMAYSSKVIVDLEINKDGSLQTSNIIKSSGSKQIDGIVLQSVKETLTYLKIPANEVSGNSVSATLIINF